MKAILSNRSGIILILVIALVAAALYFFLPSSDEPRPAAAARPPVNTARISAAVLEPADGSQYDDHAPIPVRAQATSPDMIVSLELWVDGELANVLAAPQGGLVLFTTEYLWQPLTPGDHTLVVRAVDASGHSVYSKATHVQISAYDYEGGFEEDAQAVGPAVVAIGAGLGNPGGGFPPPPVVPGPGESVGVSQPWEDPSGDSADDLAADSLPSAPMLALEVANCVVTLSFQDNSDNEEGFGVYRQMPNSAAWIKIAVLSAQSEFEWISYDDAGTPGTPMYYVAAFNSYGESQSNLAPAIVDPASCPENGAELPVVSVEIISLQFDMAAEQTYCYLSIADQVWTRSPDDGFYDIGVAGELNGDSNVLNQIYADSNGDQKSAALSVAMDCWGWVGGEIYNLGQLFSAALDLNDPGLMMLNGEGMSAVLSIGILNLYQNSEVVTYELTETYDYDMLQLSVYITEDQDVCNAHLPPEYQIPTFCEPLPLPGTPGIIKFVTPLPQSYLVWDVIGEICLAGVPVQDKCRTYGQWQSAFNQFGQGEFGFEVYEFNDLGSQFLSTYTYPFMQRDMISRTAECGSGRLFTVRMWFEVFGTTVYSWPKDSHLGLAPTAVPCQPPPNQALLDLLKLIAQQQAEAEDEAQAAAEAEALAALDFVIMQVTINTLTLANSDDDDFFDAQETLEIYSYFRVSVPNYPIDNHVPWEVRVGLINVLGPAMYRNMVQIFVASSSQHKSCPDDTNASGDLGQENYFCPKRVTDGSYNLAGWTTCLGNSGTCVEKRPGGMVTITNPQSTNNNVVNLLVFGGQPLWIESQLQDYDDGSYNDPACYGHVEFIARPLADWAAMQNAPFTIQGWGIDGGTCTVTGFITAIGP